jgi:putative glutamine amidotransferase
VRSGHHQAVSKVGAGLKVAARAADGIVEALEGAGDGWAVGVQWHPEDPRASREDFDRLLGAFLAQCSRA